MSFSILGYVNKKEEISLLPLESNLEGKKAIFGKLREEIKQYGFSIGGNWDYHKGSFDTILWNDSGETIYLRLPFVVTDGELDSYNTHIRFLTPYVIKHVANVGLDFDESSLIDASGFSQFQTPVDTDAKIRDKNKWVYAGEQVVDKVLPYLN